MEHRESAVRLGLAANWRQFWLLVAINAFVGAMAGMERAVLPLVAEADFGGLSRAALLAFIAAFGAVKALADISAGALADRIGRRRVLLAGWLAGLPVPFLIISARSWDQVVLANLLLGLNQGLCWSATIIMKIDLVGSERRGMAMGLNEFSGYVAVSLSALATGYVASVAGLRPAPFYLGVVFAAAGFLLSLGARETSAHLAEEVRLRGEPGDASAAQRQPFGTVFRLATWGDRAMFAASQAGFVNNLNDGLIWGLLPVLLSGSGLSVEWTAVVAAAYPGVWGVAQLATGTLSDRLGRKWLIASGMWAQALGIAALAAGRGLGLWIGAAALLGLGTAMVYPTLLAAIGDVAHPSWRSSAVGVYRLWRDSGYVAGALLSGLLADAWGLEWAFAGVALLTALSGAVTAAVMYETHPAPGLPAARGEPARRGPDN